MERSNITIGNFTLMASTDGTAWVLPGGEWITSRVLAEQVAQRLADSMREVV